MRKNSESGQNADVILFFVSRGSLSFNGCISGFVSSSTVLSGVVVFGMGTGGKFPPSTGRMDKARVKFVKVFRVSQ